MIRVLLRAGGRAGERRELNEGEQQHLRVRRTEPGELVELRDGAGLVGTGRLIRDRKSWVVEVVEAGTRPPPADLVLAVGAGDRDRFAWLVEKAAELGVTRLVPLETARTAGVATRVRGAHLERLRRRALEAVKQCGAAWAPSLDPPAPLAEFVERAGPGRRWVADASGDPPPGVIDPAPLVVVVGPEGGLTGEELQLLRDRGFAPVALGPHTLRFETAALAAAAAAVTARRRGEHD